MPGENFALSSINKGQLKDLQNYLNQNMMDATNTVAGSVLGDNLISHQVDYMPSAIISAEAVENDQEHITICSNQVGSITPLVQ